MCVWPSLTYLLQAIHYVLRCLKYLYCSLYNMELYNITCRWLHKRHYYEAMCALMVQLQRGTVNIRQVPLALATNASSNWPLTQLLKPCAVIFTSICPLSVIEKTKFRRMTPGCKTNNTQHFSDRSQNFLAPTTFTTVHAVDIILCYISDSVFNQFKTLYHF